MTLAGLMAEGRAALRAAGVAEADLDARRLVGEALALSPADFVMRAGEDVDKAAQERAQALLARRARGEPVHRILGRRAFYAHDFALSPATLEPRPDTETLVDLCRAPIAAAIGATGRCRIVDVGTGTGAIAVSLLALFPQASCLAVDISAEALETAMRNAQAAGVAARFSPIRSDYLAAVAGPADLLVSNPPYIPSAAIAGLAREVREHDPRLALDGGPDGLDAYRALAADAARVLAETGEVCVEIGAGQGPDVERLFAEGGLVLAASAADLGGVTRALRLRPA